MISISEANQNFSKVARLVDQLGSVVILKNNAPRYVVMEFSQAEKMQITSDDLVLASSEKLMKRNRKVYEALSR